MPNEKNLIPNSERSPDELREMARRGGQASGAARRRKRDMKNAARMILSLPADEKVSSLLSQLGIPEEDQTMQVAILAAMAMKARRAMSGPLSSFVIPPGKTRAKSWRKRGLPQSRAQMPVVRTS